MRRRIIMALLAVGVVGGYASGFAHMRRACHDSQWQGWRERAAYEHRGSDCNDRDDHARPDGDDR